jgi:hypothetical protein
MTLSLPAAAFLVLSTLGVHDEKAKTSDCLPPYQAQPAYSLVRPSRHYLSPAEASKLQYRESEARLPTEPSRAD